MRPIRRNQSPIAVDFDKHEDARPELLRRLGPYCSYCERHIVSAIHVEHVQCQHRHPELKSRWDNFLLACSNCNGTKTGKEFAFSEILFPDRDNTFAAFSYADSGAILADTEIGSRSLALTGLSDKDKIADYGRISQRREAWKKAQDAMDDLRRRPGSSSQAITLATETGFFSVWMTVFTGDPEMRNRLINAFPGTRESGCFDDLGNPVSPAPNPDGLEHGGKA